MPNFKTCLWFQGDAEPAAKFYASLFPNSKIVNVMRAGPGDDAPVIGVEFVLDGREFMAINGRHERGFTDAWSIFIPCESQQEVDRYWNALVAGGKESQCGWLVDRYGVSWQVIPKQLPALLSDPDAAKRTRVFQAMLPMQKLDIAALERARDGASSV